MFTGIIQSMGEIRELEKTGDWKATITSPQSWGVLPLGASVGCSGVCLTVIAAGEGWFQVQISAETISKTTIGDWTVGGHVNLERALCMGDELGGHIVTGHVDAVARIVGLTPEGDSLRFSFEVPDAFAKYVAPKGSVALDGISLTVNEVDGNRFGVNIIPHTRDVTTMGKRQVGDRMNFEVDVIARYVARMLQAEGK